MAERVAPMATGLAAVGFQEAPIAAVIVCVAEEDGGPRFVEANSAFYAMVGCDRSADLYLVSTDVIEGIDQVVARAQASAGVCQVAGRCAGAQMAPVMLYGSVLTAEGGDHEAGLILIQVVEQLSLPGFPSALQESEKRIQDLVDNVGALIYVKDLTGRFLIVNRHFEEMFGISRAQSPSHTSFDFFPPAVADIYAANDRLVVDSGVSMEFEEPRAGGGMWLSLKFPLFGGDGEIYAVGGISTDITGRSQAEATARRAKEAAERVSLAKSELLSRMSHELRTPLNSILGFGQLLQMQNLADGDRESADHIVRAGTYLLELINEVLEVSRSDAIAGPILVVPVDVCLPLHEAIELSRPLAIKRQIDLAVDLHEGLYQLVLTDARRLTQVILNVLTNAIKYNHDFGQVSIWFDKSRDGWLRLLISDTGRGIAKQDLERAFMPFDRLDVDATETEGTGLGLALSRSLIEAMGGLIGVESSSKKKGTTFFIELPLAAAEDVAQAEARTPDLILAPADISIGNATIIHIDDDAANIALVKGLLAQFPGIRLIEAASGGLGLELALRHRADLILLDLHLPNMDGAEVLRRLHDNPATAGIPVIMVSADATYEQQDRLLQLGALAYITKPLDALTFLMALERALANKPS